MYTSTSTCEICGREFAGRHCPTCRDNGAMERYAAGRNWWDAVTDVPCPCPDCDGTVRWAEAGYVPGYRICDACGAHFMAAPNGAYLERVE